ncbi:uroporphyrinogen-III C-methyltransferase [Pseudomonas sp. ABC1]|uniref:uroporphyrinogen-III C-methyltransferase n=1 Tax=Pseudomonas sp. ABC1 TaxID=2748080 RepID=UPI0015C375ED|nr:uroporphyrinogen-III C-methyltransferase [Pseudomonas sp. ABC1]QLF93134.1 uroporphyrinogen-III C-methyltransferase [Pseudomonas sp. ABC1]
MSEADLHKDSEQPKALPGQSAPDAAKPSGPPASGRSLAALALLVGLAGSALGGYSLWQIQQSAAQERQGLQALQETQTQLGQLSDNAQRLQGRLAPLERLPSADELEERRRLLASVQSEQQHLAGRVEQVLGSSREAWRLAEAEHLLRMAMLRLSAMQDVNSAVALLHEADLILQKQDDPAAYGVRQKLLEGLEALRSLPELDRTGLFLQLGALRGQTAQLNTLLPEFQTGEALPEVAGQSRWERWLNELTRYVRIDFDANDNIKPLLAGQSLAQVRLALALAIEQAQWAVLNGNTEVYRQSLHQAVELIGHYFSEENGQSRGLRDRLQALIERQVQVTLPDLAPALQALQAYVDKRETSELEPAEDAAPAEAGKEGAAT